VRQGEKLNVSFFPVRRAPVIHILPESLK